ncbi:MAG: response regulator transcription factor [Bacteroidetes bacterium]|nr:response regulator transcription factor [Bacteroidota bacterium]HET6243340.1 LytTR family DNA-binding domain-containing protein [Bacteroidia bacterium]
MKALIIDDERLARQELKSLLSDYSEIEIIGEANNADEAIEQIKEKQPDLIFLDIQMPEKNGFQMLEQLDAVPYVIFVTAYDEYALKAFEVNALDYLLKPIQTKRLDEALKKVMQIESKTKVHVYPEHSIIQGLLGENDQVFVKDGEKCWFVKLSEIRLFESEGNYVRVYFNSNRPLILKSLNSLEERLDSKAFFRASRKHIINLKWISKIESWFNGGLMVTLEGGEQVEISRRQSAKFREMMSL